MSKKSMIKILVIILLFNSYTYNALPIINDSRSSDKSSMLGSVEYVGKIENMAKKFGNRSALSSIMIEIDKNEKELDNNVPNNILRFHKLVSSLIYIKLVMLICKPIILGIS